MFYDVLCLPFIEAYLRSFSGHFYGIPTVVSFSENDPEHNVALLLLLFQEASFSLISMSCCPLLCYWLSMLPFAFLVLFFLPFGWFSMFCFPFCLLLVVIDFQSPLLFFLPFSWLSMQQSIDFQSPAVDKQINAAYIALGVIVVRKYTNTLVINHGKANYWYLFLFWTTKAWCLSGVAEYGSRCQRSECMNYWKRDSQFIDFLAMTSSPQNLK